MPKITSSIFSVAELVFLNLTAFFRFNFSLTVFIPTKLTHKYGLCKPLTYISDLKPQGYLGK